IALVTAVTLLIWAFAESESLRTEKLALDLRLEGASDRVLRIAPDQDWKRPAEATVEGSTGAHSAIRHSLIHHPNPLAPGSGIPIPSAPVQVRLPGCQFGHWEIDSPEEQPLLKDVTVSGPRDQVGQIRARSTGVIAFVPLTFVDLDARVTTRQAVFSELPTTL